MTDISFTCPHCKQRLAAPPEMAAEQLVCPTCQKPIQVPTTTPVRLVAERDSLVGRVVAGTVGGLILATLAANISTVILGDPMAQEPSKGTTVFSVLVFLALWAIAIVVGIKAQRAAKAWRRLLISNACLSFALPLAAFIQAGRATHQFAAKGADLEAAVSVGAGGLVTICFAILGFFLGAIFLTVGLLVGRDRREMK